MTRLAITTDPHICKFTIHNVPDRPGVAADLFGRFGAAGINILLLASAGSAVGRSDVSVTVGADDAVRLARLLESARAELSAQSVSERHDVAAISLISQEMRRLPGVAGRMFRALSAHGINIDMITAADAAVTCVIDERFLASAQKALQQEFRQELSVP
ncbi:MAG: ACT domain-containing protein [Candidatus Zixiibacteriota bacterium]